MNAVGKLVSLVLLAAASSLLPVGPATAANHRIECGYAEAGAPGPQGNRLDIRVRSQEEAVALSVRGNGRIEVSDDQRMRRLVCSGRKPTVTNIDRVSYRAARRAENTNFTISRPLDFAPGATPQVDGGDGIIFAIHGKSIVFGVVGTPEVDELRAGRAGGAVGVDFGPDPAGGIDARIDAKNITLIALMRGGDDVFSGDGGESFGGPLTGTPLTVYGEAGNDRIRGGGGPDILDGGLGKDSLTGLAGADILTGGPGVDSFDGGAGRDEIDAIDRRAETIECGGGRDLADLDLVDEDSNCEAFSFP